MHPPSLSKLGPDTHLPNCCSVAAFTCTGRVSVWRRRSYASLAARYFICGRHVGHTPVSQRKNRDLWVCIRPDRRHSGRQRGAFHTEGERKAITPMTETVGRQKAAGGGSVWKRPSQTQQGVFFSSCLEQPTNRSPENKHLFSLATSGRALSFQTLD